MKSIIYLKTDQNAHLRTYWHAGGCHSGHNAVGNVVVAQFLDKYILGQLEGQHFLLGVEDVEVHVWK